MVVSILVDILGMNNFGWIEKGYVVDLVLFDKNFEVLIIWIDGEIY